jgi:hypothetical protein
MNSFAISRRLTMGLKRPLTLVCHLKTAHIGSDYNSPPNWRIRRSITIPHEFRATHRYF